MTKDIPRASDAAAFEEKALKTVRSLGLFSRGDRVLCALSGGKDSVALLMFLLRTAGITGISVCAVHLNHSLRGEDSDSDESFVRELCAKHSVKLVCEKRDIAALSAQRGESIELAARSARYDLFLRAMDKLGCNKTATAHTASDNTETVLLNLMRGSGLRGICGIPAKRDCFVRPLIGVSGEEVLNYLSALGQDFVTDKSNLTDDYTRNVIRHNVVPVFKEKNPSFDFSVLRLSELARSDTELIERIAHEKAIGCGADFDRRISPQPPLRALAADRAYTGVLYEILCSLSPDRSLMTYERLSAVRKVLLSESGTGVIELSGKTQIILDGKQVKVVQSKDVVCAEPEYSRKLTDGELFLPEIDTKLCVRTVKNSEDFVIIHTKNRKICFNQAVSDGDLYVRNRRPGDKIVVSGMTKSLKKLFSERKIPSAERRFFPVVCDSSGIVAVCGICVADRVRINGKTDCMEISIVSSPAENLF